MRALYLSLLIGAALALPVMPTLAQGAEPGAHNQRAQVGPARERVIVVGRITGNPRKQFPRTEKFARHLAAQLKDLGIVEGRAVTTRDNAEMATRLREGEVDMFSETVFSSLWLERLSLSKPILREWKDGVAEYHAVLVVHKDSGIKSLADLAGKTVAFEDRSSTSGFLLPYAMIRRAGLDFVELSGPRERAPAGKVGYVFSAGEVNGAVWVQRRLVAATALSNIDWDDVTRAPGPIKNELEILASSRPVVRSVTNFRAGLNPRLRERLIAVLVAIKDDPEAQKLSKTYNKIHKFEAFDTESVQGLDEARDLMRRLGPVGY